MSPRSVFKKLPGGVASTTRDRGYSDWLNIKRPPPSAAILKGEVLNVICVLFMFVIDYVKILISKLCLG